MEIERKLDASWMEVEWKLRAKWNESCEMEVKLNGSCEMELMLQDDYLVISHFPPQSQKLVCGWLSSSSTVQVARDMAGTRSCHPSS